MKRFFGEVKQAADKIKPYGLLLLILLVLSAGSILILRHEMLSNARTTGNTLAKSYAVEEERSGTAYESLLYFGAARLERYVEDGIGKEALEQWFAGFCTDIESIAGKGTVDPYAVVNGRIVAANPWEGDDTYDYSSTDWYQKAIEADGQVIYTNAYMDVIYSENIITLAVSSGDNGNVVAFDIFPENFRIQSQDIDLPEGASYYLCDGNGTLLYAQTEMDADQDEMQAYMDDIIEKMENGELNALSSYIIDTDGEKRAVYFNRGDNGWLSIVTVPHSTIFGTLYFFTFGFSAVFAVFCIFILLTSVWGYRLNRRVEETNETLRVLGNSYYAIYRVDYLNGTYDMIKGSDYVRSRLPERGDYEQFLEVAKEVMEESTRSDFTESFSLANMRKLVKRRVRDYGGDFLRYFDNEYRWVNVRLLFDESLSQGEVALCFREVEKEKQAQLRQIELLENALDKAKKSEASQGRFFSSMSHDMRTPLNAVIGLSELAAANVEDTEKTRDYLNKITVSSRQLLGLINDILELSRLERGNVELNAENFDLRKCIAESMDVFRVQAAQSGRQFELALDIRDDMVKGDPSRLTQVMNNLVSNAMKFTRSGGKVTVKVHQLEMLKYAKYQFTVEDTGRGMSEEFLTRIFEPYAREVRFGADNVPGTGLGLSIVKSLVSQMDGQITVESELGKGSRFIVTLPLETANNQAEIPPEDSSEASVQEKETAQAETAFELAGRHILLAEDNDVNMEIATELLEMNEIKVTQAWNGKEAVERFRESEPGFFDAVLMDMQMPEMNGCDAARAIRALKRPDAQDVPILAVTANAFAEDIAATTAAGMNAHISKPIDFSILYSVLRELIALREDRNAQGDNRQS